MEEIFARSALLLGEQAQEVLSRSSVAVFGIGGVGGHAAEALARAGLGRIDLFDPDTVSITNLIRQIGVGLAKELRHRHSADKSHRRKLARHCGMLFFFILGAVTGTVFCHLLVGRAIWLTMIPLGIIFLTLLHAARTTEKELEAQNPAGH